ncbi:TPA: hypothetical protein N0F65_006711 [Lagenidium giganteum]|uniref:Cation-transporting P-type ATPase N-terminal domain-containing protein n=1 Tax=Lagenidium giganteum TaxID=4803 RepID=A0AAV2Z3M7_9STRA|nr:TPA: hypothetical protein N0F65_006711 [Lagenidium giganteum]
MNVDFCGGSVANLLAKIAVDPSTGLTRDEAMARRTLYGTNRVTPPVNCPSWVCCLLPCLLRTASMQAYHLALPKEAVVRRKQGPNMRRMRMDVSSLVVGDVLEFKEGSIVGADVRVIECSEDCTVDQTLLTGEADDLEDGASSTKRVSVESSNGNASSLPEILRSEHILLMTTQIRTGTAVGVVIATGDQTVWGQMLAQHQWPTSSSAAWHRHLAQRQQSEEMSLLLNIS